MRILSSPAIHEWDQFTILNEPISPIDLMERAATRCGDWILQKNWSARPFQVYCGKGNNGGDGLAIARQLAEKKYLVDVYILEFGHPGTAEFQENLSRLHRVNDIGIHFIQDVAHIPNIPSQCIIIDALLGSGLNRELDGLTATLVRKLNESPATIVSIDIPSGMPADAVAGKKLTIKATDTLSFQCYKPAFLLPENQELIGQLSILDIGLKKGFRPEDERFFYSDIHVARSLYKPRNEFAHKGNFGHAYLLAGSYGKIGAAVLCGEACLRAGAGLLTVHLPSCGYTIIQTAVPEAMVSTDSNSSFSASIPDDLETYNALGIGPGIGTTPETRTLLKDIFFRTKKPMVLDADALNIMARETTLLNDMPAQTILTPHPKEFDRLFGESKDSMDRIEKCLALSRKYNCLIVLKGHYSLIATPEGKGYFNSSGNAGMATGGSGDVLTGILTSLLAQGYSSIDTALLGVFLHGLAGDMASMERSMEAMLAGDITENLGRAYREIGK